MLNLKDFWREVRMPQLRRLADATPEQRMTLLALEQGMNGSARSTYDGAYVIDRRPYHPSN